MRYPLRHFILFIIITSSLCEVANAKELISTQSCFDALVDRINSGESVDAILSRGQYVLHKPIRAKNNLSISSSGATITFGYNEYTINEAIGVKNGYYICRLKTPVSPFSLFVNGKGEIVPVSEIVENGKGVIVTPQRIIGNYISKEVMPIIIPFSESYVDEGNYKFNNAFGYFDCAWSRYPFKVDTFSNGTLNCHTISDVKIPNFNYNVDKYHKENRYVLYNVCPTAGHIYYTDDCIYIPLEQKSIKCIPNQMSGSHEYSIKVAKDVYFRGITFSGFNGILVSSKPNSTCLIEDCVFRNTLSYALVVVKSQGDDMREAIIRGCTFENCALFSDYAVDLRSDIVGRNCITLCNCSLSKYTDGIAHYKACTGLVYVNADATIIGCTLFNSARDHLMLNSGRIIINGNQIFNTTEFNSHVLRNLSADFGLIYCNHIYKDSESAIQNTVNSIVITENLIYGAEGYGHVGRGVFIDDGRGDVTCTSNVIFNCQSHTIDSRAEDSYIGSSSIRNRISNNVLVGSYRLISGKYLTDDQRAVASGNYYSETGKNSIRNIIVEVEDTQLSSDDYLLRPDYLYLSRSMKKNVPKWLQKNSHIKFRGKKTIRKIKKL